MTRCDEKLPTCQYKYESIYPVEIKFECDEPSIPNRSFCIFHDEDLYAEHKREATEGLEEKVLESISRPAAIGALAVFLSTLFWVA